MIDDGAGGPDGAGVAADGSDATAGHGLAGLRERTHLLGGQLQAGCLSAGGFRLSVSVPAVAGSGPQA